MTPVSSSWRLARALSVVALTPALVACAALGVDSVPPPPPAPASLAVVTERSPQVLRRWIAPGERGAERAFVPLKLARQEIAQAAGSPGVAEHAPAHVEQARSALARAEKRWQAIAAAPLESPRKLVAAAHAAHQARRHAQIAQAIAAREQGLRNLGVLHQRMQQRAAFIEQWVGRKLIPGPLGDVRFALGTAELTEDSRPTIRKLVAFLEKHRMFSLRLIGHSDNTAPTPAHMQAFLEAHPELAKQLDSRFARIAAYNKALARRRAAAVKQALVAAGIDPNRLQVESRGASQPIADNSTAAGRRKNRRVVAIVVLPDTGESKDSARESASGK